MSVDNDTSAADKPIDDKYSGLSNSEAPTATTSASSNKRIAPSEDPHNDNGENDKRDVMTRKREDFLTIYKEDEGKDGKDGDNDEPDLSSGIRFRRDADEEDSGFELKTGSEGTGKKPLI